MRGSVCGDHLEQHAGRGVVLISKIGMDRGRAAGDAALSSGCSSFSNDNRTKTEKRTGPAAPLGTYGAVVPGARIVPVRSDDRLHRWGNDLHPIDERYVRKRWGTEHGHAVSPDGRVRTVSTGMARRSPNIQHGQNDGRLPARAQGSSGSGRVDVVPRDWGTLGPGGCEFLVDS